MMPAKSAAQKRLMDAAAHNPAFAKKVGIPSKVAKEFSQASKGQTFKRGGEMKAKKYMDGGRTSLPSQAAARATQALAARPALPTAAMGARPFKKGGSVGMTAMGKVKTAAPSRDGVAVKGKTKGKMVTMRAGGKACK